MLSSILMLISGFGVFLFGINTFSSNIEKISGNKMRKKINRFSRNRFTAISSGFIFTTIMQSSKAGIILIAGFTSAGIIGLFQGISLTVGSSIASAVPNFLISITSFNIKEFFYALAGIGILINLFSKKAILKNISVAIIGFSLIFIGMGMMGTGTSIFSSNPAFINFFQTLTNPILLILIGIGFTIITQSSLATIAVLMTLVGTTSAVGIISISSAAYIIFGANIGSAITTAIVINLSSNIDGKRIGLFHIIHMTVGVILFSLISLFPWIDALFSWISEPSLKLAFINLTFHFITGLLFIPLLKPAVCLVKKILPNKSNTKNVLEIDEVLNESPSISLAKVNEKIMPFFDSMISLYNRMLEYIIDEDNSKYKNLFKDLSYFNYWINKLNMYAVRIATNEVYDDVKEIELLLNTIKQVERINRNCIKILLILKNNNKKITYSLNLQKFTDIISNNTKEMFEIIKKFIQHPDCKFLENKKPSHYDRMLELSHINSKTKLSAKTFVIDKGFGTKSSTEKNTSYIELVSYLGLISNNLLDIMFGIVGQANNSLKPKFEQLILDGISTN